MTKQINPDVIAFKDDFFKGLSLRECFYGGSAIAVGVGLILLLHFYCKWNINAAITIAMPLIGLIGLCGFYHKNDMTLIQYIREMIRIGKQKTLTFESGHEFGLEVLEEAYEGHSYNDKRKGDDYNE